MVEMRKHIPWLVIGLLICSSFALAAEKKIIKVKVGQPFTIKLKSNPTTGYIWSMPDLPKSSTIRLVSIKYFPARSDLLGSGGEEHWCFQALKKGETNLTLNHLRCWEKDTPPIEVNTYKAVVID